MLLSQISIIMNLRHKVTEERQRKQYPTTILTGYNMLSD